MDSTVQALWNAAAARSPRAVAKALTHVEEGGGIGRELVRLADATGVATPIVGVTGPPGAGKSSLVSSLIGAWRRVGETVAVVAVDPSSPFSGGAILGDRIRMIDHALDEGVFVRSLASRGQVGGLSFAAPATARFLAAVGFDHILLETVGVGQAELAVADNADTTVVVLNPGWGDAVQANKAGVLEIADVFVINKADRPGVDSCRAELESMLGLAQQRDGWAPPIVLTSCVRTQGFDDLRTAIGAHLEHLRANDLVEARRKGRRRQELLDAIMELLRDSVNDYLASGEGRELMESAASGEADIWSCATEVQLVLSGTQIPPLF